MHFSTDLLNIFRKLRNEENANWKFIDLITKRRVSKEFLFIDVSDKDDYVRFIPNKKSNIELVTYKLRNPTIVENNHQIYETAMKSIADQSKISKSFNKEDAYKVLGQYPAYGEWLHKYLVIHMENMVDGTQILNLQEISSPPNIEANFNNESITKGELKIGRFLRKIITEQPILDKDVEVFVNAFKAHNLYQKNFTDYFKVVEGNDIKFWYDANKYTKNCGNLNGSCMRLEKCKDFFNIYTNPENNVKMVILTDYNDKLVGRALLWETSEGKYMDRVYAQDHTIKAFIKWAEANDYNMQYDNRSWDNPISVRLKINLIDSFPYLDTFRYMQTDEGDIDGPQMATLMPTEPSRFASYYILSGTDGTYGKVNIKDRVIVEDVLEDIAPLTEITENN